jgi:hypothetical protein
MPLLSRWALRAGLLWFALALAAGVALAWPGVPAPAYPTYLHLLTVGWLTNLITGVAHWMFPRASAERPRGTTGVGWAGLALLNAGLVARGVGESVPVGGRAAWLAVAAALQLAGGWCWVAHLWPRIKGR